jgi:hypothetical protein
LKMMKTSCLSDNLLSGNIIIQSGKGGTVNAGTKKRKEQQGFIR